VDLPNAANVKVGDIVHAPRFTISGRDKVMKEHGNRLDARPVSGILVDGSIVSKGKTLTFSTAATEITYVIEGLQINVTVPMALLVFEMDDQLFKFDRTTGHHSMELTSQESGARSPTRRPGKCRQSPSPLPTRSRSRLSSEDQGRRGSRSRRLRSAAAKVPATR